MKAVTLLAGVATVVAKFAAAMALITARHLRDGTWAARWRRP